MNKRLYLITCGYQMNDRDSEEVLGMLTAHVRAGGGSQSL